MRDIIVVVALAVAAQACGKKSESVERDPMKLCETFTADGVVSGCTGTTTALDPELAPAKTLVEFQLEDPAGTGQIAIFADEATAKSAFMALQQSSTSGIVLGDYPTRLVIYLVAAGANKRGVDGHVWAVIQDDLKR